MVWGAFCGELKSEIFDVPSGAKLDSATYALTILDPLLIPLWHECCEYYGWVKVVEDGAPGHKGFSKACREQNGVDSLEWVPQSPDLNLIEALLGDIEVELGERYGRIRDLEEVKQRVHEIWQEIGRDRLLSLVKSMPTQVQAVLAVNGCATPY
ncbi:hypothetical protein DFH27DRAFT_486692 [Peziza echinospora]|nr:hypothetical protein DFH27DRAFT_486692 [Peziza echinospora]